nr:PQQ-binding-like beta-propeller repeat protein [Halovivax sp. KZCA124]
MKSVLNLDEKPWTMARYDAANTGYNPTASAPSTGIVKDWMFPVEGNTHAAPVVGENTVYAGAGEALYAIEKKNSHQHWKRELGYHVGVFSPVITQDLIFVAGRHEEKGKLFALDREFGEIQWSISTGKPESPIVWDRTVYLAETTTNGSQIRAFSFDGSQKWQTSVAEEYRNSLSSHLAVSSGNIFVSVTCESRENADNSKFVRTSKFDIETGQEQWVSQTKGQTSTSPAVASGQVFVADQTGLLRSLDEETGEEQWRFDTGYSIQSSPAIAHDVVYTGTYTGEFYAIDCKTGDELWRTSIDVAYTDAAITDETVVVGDGPIYGLSAIDGTTKWVHDETGFSTTNYSPVLSDDAVFVGLCVKADPEDMYDNSIIKLIEPA